MTLLVDSPALMLTVQDQGRSGYQRFGLPESGPMDWWAFRAANALVGNSGDCACLEIGFTATLLSVEADALMALTGAGYRLCINQRYLPLWMAFRVKSGDVISLEKTPGGNWSYLAVSGGFLSPEWLGSCSAYPRAGLGRSLIAGDRIPLSAGADGKRWLAGSVLPELIRPPYSPQPNLRVVIGPHPERFLQEDLQTFLNAGYSLSTQSDRMGYRLTGPVLRHRDGADLISQGMALGEIQVPSDGQPIVMMPDHPTTGGYTCIGTVAKVDLPVLAQVQPGEAEIHFQHVEVDQAQDALRDVNRRLDSAVQSQEESWLMY